MADYRTQGVTGTLFMENQEEVSVYISDTPRTAHCGFGETVFIIAVCPTRLRTSNGKWVNGQSTFYSQE